jgi:hypothetical protein
VPCLATKLLNCRIFLFLLLLQGHTPHTHHSLELLLQCRFVAHHSELRSLVLTNLSSCPPLGQLTALEQLALRGCGSQATPLDQLDISDLTKLRHIGELAHTPVPADLLLQRWH